MSIRYISSRTQVARDSFPGKILAEIRREFGAEVEPFTLHLPVPELLAGVWMACRETLLADNGRRDAKEVVATAISELNQCPYCVDAHSMMILSSAGSDYPDALKDPYLSAVAAWASATRNSDSPLLRKPPFPRQEAPAFIGTAVVFHYINRMVSILLGSSPLPFTQGLPKKIAMQLAAWFFGGAVRREKEPGKSLDLLPDCPLPNDLLWAKPSRPIAGAFARFAQAVENAGSEALSPEVRRAVSKAARRWNGVDPGMNTMWCDEAIVPLGEMDKCAGRLAFYTAFAPYRVNEGIVKEFSDRFPGDKNLISALAWSSFTAARRIGTWL